MEQQRISPLDPASEAGRAALTRVAAEALGGPVTLGDIAALSGGAASATWAVDSDAGPLIFQRTEGERFGGEDMLSRAVQAEVVRRAGALGVPVPGVVAAPPPEAGLGDSVLWRRVAGEAMAPRWLRQPDYAAARERLTMQCAEALARLHVAPIGHWDGLSLPGGSGAALLEALFIWYCDNGVNVPAFDLAFAWLRPRMSDAPATCLVHGDFRSGNILVDHAGLTAAIDWELTHFSVPAEDLGWLCVQAWRFGQWQKPVGGFGERAELIAAYRAAGGVVSEADLYLWEVYGTLKWGLSCLQLAEDHVSGRVPSVERAVIGRRVSEVAADLVHLIAFGDL